MKTFNELFNSSNIISEDTNECLFSDSCPTGYFTKSEFLSHLNSLDADKKLRWQLEHIRTFFDFAKIGGTLSRIPQHSVENGIGITWLNIKIGKVIRSIKIIHFSGIKQLIDDYATGSLKVSQNLEELYKEALGQ